jgi:hypothetical protein
MGRNPSPGNTRDLSFAFRDKFKTLEAQNDALAGGSKPRRQFEKLEQAPRTPFSSELINLFKVIDATEANDSWIKLTKSPVSCADVQRDEFRNGSFATF